MFALYLINAIYVYAEHLKNILCKINFMYLNIMQVREMLYSVICNFI